MLFNKTLIPKWSNDNFENQCCISSDHLTEMCNNRITETQVKVCSIYNENIVAFQTFSYWIVIRTVRRVEMKLPIKAFSQSPESRGFGALLPPKKLLILRCVLITDNINRIMWNWLGLSAQSDLVSRFSLGHLLWKLYLDYFLEQYNFCAVFTLETVVKFCHLWLAFEIRKYLFFKCYQTFAF